MIEHKYVECNGSVYEVVSDYVHHGIEYYFLTSTLGPCTAKCNDCIPVMLLKDLKPGTKFKFSQSPSTFILADYTNVSFYMLKLQHLVLEVSNGLLHEFSGEQPVHPA